MELERLNQQQFNQFRDFIYAKSGIRIDEKKVTLLSNRIRRRLKAGNFQDFDTYYGYLVSRDGESELEGFLDAITTNETAFFRTQKHFDWLMSDWIDELVAQQRAGDRPASVRIWSAACSNGAEPYSIAICLAERSHLLRGWSLKIVGSDISEQALREAEHGVYKSRAIESVTEQQRRRHFKNVGDDLWEVRPEIKQLVEFRKCNLIHAAEDPGFDCIFIRNVLIYFDRDSKRVVVDHLINALARGGYLVIGPSEGIYDMLERLEKISQFLYRKPVRPEQRTHTV